MSIAPSRGPSCPGAAAEARRQFLLAKTGEERERAYEKLKRLNPVMAGGLILG